MTKTIKVLTACSILLMGANTAFANEEPDQVAFKYDASAPAEQTYEVLTQQAINACKDAYGTFAVYASRKCVRRTVNEAVEKINSAQLIAFHKGPDAKKAIVKLAEANTSQK